MSDEIKCPRCGHGHNEPYNTGYYRQPSRPIGHKLCGGCGCIFKMQRVTPVSGDPVVWDTWTDDNPPTGRTA